MLPDESNQSRVDLEPYRKEFRRFIDSGSQAKRSWTVKAKVALHQYTGVYHTYHDEGGTRIWVDESLARGIFKVPVVPRLVDLSATTIMAEPSNWHARPAGSTQEDAQAAEAKTLIIREHEQRNAVHVNNITLSRGLVTTGKNFKKLYTEESIVPIEIPKEIFEYWRKMKTERDGREPVIQEVYRAAEDKLRVYTKLPVIRETNITPFSMIVETGARNLDEAQVFACHELRSRRWIEQQFPDFDVEKLKPQSITDRHMPVDRYGTGGSSSYSYDQQTGDSFSPEANLVRVYDCFMRLNNGNWLHMVLAGNRYEILLAEETQTHNYVDYTCNPIEDYFWGYGLVDRVKDLQRGVNRSATDLKLNLHENMKDIIVLSHEQRDKVGTHYGSVLYQNPRNPFRPFRMEMPTSAHQVLKDHLQSDIQYCYEVFGFSEASLGKTKSHVTAMGMQLAQRADQSTLHTIRTYLNEGERRKNQKLLRMAKDIFDEPRFVAIAGAGNAKIYDRVIHSQDVGGAVDVVLKDSVALPATKDERFQLMQNLMQSGAFQPGNEAALQRAREFVNMETGLLPQDSSERMERDRATREGEWIANGRVVPQGGIPDIQGSSERQLPVIYVGPGPNRFKPLLRGTDIDEIHIEQHENDVRRGRFTGNRQMEIAAAMHIQEHKDRVRQREAQSMASQLEMMAQESTANQAGQIASAAANSVMDSGGSAKDTPADGGRKSGESRRQNQ